MNYFDLCLDSFVCCLVWRGVDVCCVSVVIVKMVCFLCLGHFFCVVMWCVVCGDVSCSGCCGCFAF